jgi:SAM-dependent methyltransferase
MTEKNSKSLMTFDAVISDYVFFQEHITEIAEMRRHFAIHLAKMSFSNEVIKYLDFGCGDGGIPAALERDVPNLNGKTQFSMVEPTDAQRNAAIRNLQPRSCGPVMAYPYLSDEVSETYDFILASHSLYYVPDLKNTIQSLHARLNPNALFIIAMECSSSPAKKIWEIFFESIGLPIPYHLPEAVRETLTELKIPFTIDPLRAKMEFPDSVENRRHIMRFLLDPYYKQKPEEEILSFFDPYSRNGVVLTEMSNDLFIIKT